MLIPCLWGYGHALTLNCHWLKLLISLIVLIINESERSVPFAAHCAEVSVNTVKSTQTSPCQTNLDKNFVKPEQTVCEFCQAAKCFCDFSPGRNSGHSQKSSSPTVIGALFLKKAHISTRIFLWQLLKEKSSGSLLVVEKPSQP